MDKLEDGAKYGLWRRALEMKQSAVYLPNPLDWGQKFEEPVSYTLHTLKIIHTCVYIYILRIYVSF